jgi:hypothetical protein
MMRTLNRPVKNTNPEAVKDAGYTHQFGYSMDPDDGARCDNCDCRPGSVSAGYPCGTNVPREIVTFGEKPGEIISIERVA